jgi:undecaprenyl diphosphate synthase
MTQNTASIPLHLAIIMDGNGRWARQRMLPRILGHRAGASTLVRVVRAAAERGIRFLSIYAFSTENWQRPRTEVLGLMALFRAYARRKVRELVQENVRLLVAGRIEDFPQDLRELLEYAQRETAVEDPRLTLIACLNYGGRQEILDAIRKIRRSGTAEEIDEENFRRYLYLPDVPDPDLIVRTSGEMRLSNFWLWQGSYSELYFTEKLWPDFDESELDKALSAYTKRERRYGNVQSAVS